jgi:hypothetical protein
MTLLTRKMIVPKPQNLGVRMVQGLEPLKHLQIGS